MKKLLALLSALVLCFSLSTCAYTEEMVPDYLDLLLEAAVTGDGEAGRLAAAERNAYLDRCRSAEPRVDFDDLMLLARLIQAEAGDSRYSDEMRLCVGEVVLNRVASPEYPDTLEEVIFQKGQYRYTEEPEFRDGLLPSRASAQAALRLLLGERMMEPQVLFQSDYRIGPVYARFFDRLTGYTYFCESMRRDLYPSASDA